MDFKKHLVTAWDLTLKHIIPLVFMTLLMLIISILTGFILFPLTIGGYTHSLLRMVKEGREPKIQDIFSQMKYFLPLLGFFILYAVLTMIGMVLVLPGILIMLGVIYFCIYMIPFMVDKDVGLIDALQRSYKLSLQGEMIDHIILVLLYVGIIAIGGTVFFIGTLFTMPFATIFMLSVYREKLLTFDTSEKPTIEMHE